MSPYPSIIFFCFDCDKLYLNETWYPLKIKERLKFQVSVMIHCEIYSFVCNLHIYFIYFLVIVFNAITVDCFHY